jgi:hypothetical protein
LENAGGERLKQQKILILKLEQVSDQSSSVIAILTLYSTDTHLNTNGL